MIFSKDPDRVLTPLAWIVGILFAIFIWLPVHIVLGLAKRA